MRGKSTVHTILTDNGSEFTDRFGGARWRPLGQTPSGNHPFDKVCAAHGVKHRLTKPFHPQTNGMVERFNRRIAQALRSAPPTTANQGKNRFNTNADRNAFIHAFVDAYNRTRLRCLDYSAPLQTLTNLTENNTNAGIQMTLARWSGLLDSRLRGNDVVGRVGRGKTNV